MNTGDIAEILPTYFEENPNLQEIMEKENRVYLGIVLNMDSNNYFIPLRTNAPTGPQYSKSIYPIPSSTRPNAGLDFRKALIVNDMRHVRIIENPQVANSQMREIGNKIATIENMFGIYVNGYLKAVKKNRVQRELAYKYSTLQNYHRDLKLLPEI